MFFFITLAVMGSKNYEILEKKSITLFQFFLQFSIFLIRELDLRLMCLLQNPFQ